MDAKSTERNSASTSGAEAERGGRPRRPWVLLDANALLLPFTAQFRLEVEIHRHVDGAQIAVPASVLGELERLAGRGRRLARAARSFADRFDVIPTTLQGDAAILAIARTHGAWVVTGDRALRIRLIRAGVRVLFPRGRSHLDAALAEGPKLVPARRARRRSGKG